MNQQHVRWVVQLSALLSALVVLLGLPGVAHALPPSQAFLSAPYYGAKGVGQCFHSSHTGYDYGLVYEPVLAAADGTVIRVQWANNACHNYYNEIDGDIRNCDYGLHIYIQHDNGYVSRYAHLSATAFDLGTNGVRVTAGQIIGTSGSTGFSSAPHLHFEVGPGNFPRNGGVNPGAPGDSCYVANALWKDGQWAGRPFSAPGEDAWPLLMDDGGLDSLPDFWLGRGDPFHIGCGDGNCPHWYYVTGLGYNGDMHWTYTEPTNPAWTDNYWASWTPTYPSGGGVYKIEAYTPNDNATSWQAPFNIVHAQGTTTTRIDQFGLNNQWVTLGHYSLYEGWVHQVYTTDETGEPSPAAHDCLQGDPTPPPLPRCQLGIDAVRFSRVSSVYQTQWRGDRTYSRAAFTDNDSFVLWGADPPWTASSVSSTDYLPGSGAVQTESFVVIGNTLEHYTWRGNQGWSRKIPINKGQIGWAAATGWSGPYNVNVLPGSGDMQSQSDYVIGSNLWQTHWRGNGGWYRTVPIVNGTPDWNHANPWNQTPLNLGQIACSETILAQTDYVIGSTLRQFHWCLNGQGQLESKERTVPIANGIPQWNSASPWYTGSTDDLPGSGTLQARSDFALP